MTQISTISSTKPQAQVCPEAQQLPAAPRYYGRSQPCLTILVILTCLVVITSCIAGAVLAYKIYPSGCNPPMTTPDTPTEGSTWDGTTKYGATKYGTTKYGSTPRGTTNRGTTPKGTTNHGTPTPSWRSTPKVEALEAKHSYQFAKAKGKFIFPLLHRERFRLIYLDT